MRKFTILTILMLCVTFLFAQAPEKFTYQAVVRNANNSLVTNAPVGVRVSILQGGVNGTLVYMETWTTVTNANGLITLQIGGGNVQQGGFADIDWANGSYFLKTETDPDGGSNYSITSTQQLLSVPYALYAKDAGNGFSGDYNDLTNTPAIPTVPTNVSAFNNDAGYITGYTETDPQFNAWDKDYNDLINRPTIPTVPTDVSVFNNDVGYITMDSVPTNVSTFTNDAGYITAQDIPTIPTVPTNVSAFVNDAGYLTDYTEQQVLSISNDTLFLTGGSFVKLPASTNCDTTGMAALMARMDQLERPSISTLSVENVTCHNANVTGRLINSGASWISACGFCWSTVHNPTLANSHITVTTGLGTFNSNLTGLQAGTTYYVRAYATNDAGTTYGEELSFTTTANAPPTVTTKTVTNILSNAAVCGGNVTSEGCLTVTARGVCWSTSQNPTVSDSHTTDGSGTGSFMSSISSLTAGTTYYVRAYASNIVGTAYGEVVVFTTFTDGGGAVVDEKSCPNAPTVTDHEGNVYATVQIGNQCWMRDNLRTTTSPTTGTYLIPAAGTTYTRTGKQAFWYNNDSATYAPMNYGLLYNWNAAVDTFNIAYGETSVNSTGSNVVSVSFTGHRRGICPAGWHLPSDAEWTQMTDYVSSQSEYTCGGNSYFIAKALTSTEGWTTHSNNCTVGNNQASNNATGFSAVPAGSCHGSSFGNAGNVANFWSSSQYEGGSSSAYTHGLNNNYAYVFRSWVYKDYGYSVRCIRD